MKGADMKKLFTLILCIFLAMGIASHNRVEAEPEGEIKNIHYNGDMLEWDAYPGAVYYNITLFTSGDYAEVNDYHANSLDVLDILRSWGVKSADYRPWKIEAFDAADQSIASGSSEALYSYTSYGKITSVATNLRWENGSQAVWDPVPGADTYLVEFWREGIIKWGETNTFYATMAEAEDFIIGDEYTWSFTVRAMKYGYEKSEQSEHSPRTKGTPQTFIRLAGATRYETSLLIAEEFKKVLDERMGIGAKEKLDAVFVTTGKNYPDALSGSCLANDPNTPGPLLMINQKSAPAVIDYIRKYLDPSGTVYILGGTGAVPDEWFSSLSGFNIKRIAGKNRYETNLEILRTYQDLHMGYPPSEFLVCTGEGFADALSCSALDIPILLVNSKKGLTDSQKAYLSQVQASWNNPGLYPTYYVIGGTGAVSAEIEAELGNYGKVEVRIAGKDRYTTSAAIARYYRFLPDRNEAVLATGKDFPDGLCSGPLAHLIHGPVLLVAQGHSEQAWKYFRRHNIEVKTGYISGGTGAVSDEVACDAFSVLSLD